MSSFIEFIREQGVLGLAIGFILGGATSKLVSSLVQGIIQPLVGMIFGSPNGLASLQYKSIMYGQFLVDLIDFIVIAAVIFFLFKGLRLDRLDKKKS